MTKIGEITVGQSPRNDLVPEMEPFFADSVELIQMGGLDGLTREEIERFAPGDQDHVLVSRLTDGTSVKFGESHVLPRIQTCIERLEEQGVSMILFLCTGEFPENFRSRVPLIFPNQVLMGCASSLFGKCRLAVIVPAAEQEQQMYTKWAPVASSVFVAAASPYEGTESVATAASLIPEETDLIILDCIGYTAEMKCIIRQLTGKPVLLPRTLLARLISEIA